MPPKPIAPASRVSQHLRRGERASSRRPVASASPGQAGRTRAPAATVSSAEHGHRPERRAPAEVLAEPGGGRDPDDVGDRRGRSSPSRPRGRAGPARPGWRRPARRRRSRRRAAGRPRNRATQQRARSRAPARLSALPPANAAISATQQAAARQPRAEDGEHRGADDDAERVGRDEVAGGRDRHADAVGDLGQQAHRHELGGADREAAQASARTAGRRCRRTGAGCQPSSASGLRFSSRAGSGTSPRPPCRRRAGSSRRCRPASPARRAARR